MATPLRQPDTGEPIYYSADMVDALNSEVREDPRYECVYGELFVTVSPPRPWHQTVRGRLLNALMDYAEGEPAADWEKKVYASAVSKYVFKIGRLTVHPAVVIGASGLLPDRPGGWVTDSGTATPAADPTAAAANGNGHAVAAPDATAWDWHKTEEERLKGMAFAEHFAALEGLSAAFDAGEHGALGKFTLG